MNRNGIRLALVAAAAMAWGGAASANQAAGEAVVEHGHVKPAAKSSSSSTTHHASSRRSTTLKAQAGHEGHEHDALMASSEPGLIAAHVPAHVARTIAGFLINTQISVFGGQAGPTLVFGPMNQTGGGNGPTFTSAATGMAHDAPHPAHDAQRHHAFDDDK